MTSSLKLSGDNTEGLTMLICTTNVINSDCFSMCLSSSHILHLFTFGTVVTFHPTRSHPQLVT